MNWGWEKHYPGPEGSTECKGPLGLDPFSLPLCWFLLGCSPVARFFLFCVLLQSFSLMRASAAICASLSSPQQGCAPPRSACRAGCSSLSNLPHISCTGLPASRDGEEGKAAPSAPCSSPCIRQLYLGTAAVAPVAGRLWYQGPKQALDLVALSKAAVPPLRSQQPMRECWRGKHRGEGTSVRSPRTSAHGCKEARAATCFPRSTWEAGL